MNKIWNFLIVIGIVVSFLTGSVDKIGDVIINSSKSAFEVYLKLALLIMFWNGIFNIAIESGMIKNLTRVLKRPLSRLFDDVDPNSPCMEYICANVIANMLGLGSAATPLGIKAFEALQKINNKDTPSRSMVKFVLLNISTLTFFPTTIVSLRAMSGGKNDISLICLMIIVTLCATIITLILEKIFAKIYQKKDSL